MKRSRDALMARGLDSKMADSLVRSGYTVQRLKLAEDSELTALGLNSEEINLVKEGSRPAIPSNTLLALLFANRFQCCVCRNPDRPFIVHHIKGWAKSKSHQPENLAILCLEHHAAAHSTGPLSQNLTSSVITDLKKKWEDEVKKLDSRSVIDAMKIEYSSWAYINELRLFELVTELALDATEAKYYPSARFERLINKQGLPLPTRTTTFYKYEGSHILVRYYYMKEILEFVIAHLPIINISDFLDRGTILPSILPGDFVFVEGAHTFSKIEGPDKGIGQICRGTRSANNVEVRFTFDRWEATSSSSKNDWLVGTKRAGSLVQVKNIDRDGKRVVLTGTILGISSFTSGLKTRDYDLKWLTWTPPPNTRMSRNQTNNH